MTHTYTEDVLILIRFAKNQGLDMPDLVAACDRLEEAIEKKLNDYSVTKRW